MAKRKPRIISIDPEPTSTEQPAPLAIVEPVQTSLVAESEPAEYTSVPTSTQDDAPEQGTQKQFVPVKGIRGDYVAGVRLLEDRQFKQMQLAFKDKPSDDVRQFVRDAGFQWRQAEQVWTLQIDPDKSWQTRAKADEVFERVADLLRAEKGLGQEVS